MSTRMILARAVTALVLVGTLGVALWHPAGARESVRATSVTGQPEATSVSVACPPLAGEGTTTAYAVAQGDTNPTGSLNGQSVAALKALGTKAATATISGTSGAVVTAEPAGGLSTHALGAVTAHAPNGFVGEAADLCRSGAHETWFVGGDAAGGGTLTLTLTNTSSSATSVTLEAWGATGPLTWATSTYAVGAGASVSVELAEVLVGETRPVWRVHAEGGGVAAFAQAATRDGLSPTGYSQIPPAAPPATRAYLPTGPLREGSQLRLANPGQDDATYTVRTVGADGSADLPGAVDAVVPAGAVVDVPLDGIGGDVRGLTVTADSPILSGARVRGADTSVSTDAADLGEALGVDASVSASDDAWVSALDPAHAGLLIVPEHATGQVTALFAGAGEMTITPLDGGEPTTLGAGEAAASEAPLAAGIYQFEASSDVAAGVTVSDDVGLTWLPAAPAPAEAVALTLDMRP